MNVFELRLIPATESELVVDQNCSPIAGGERPRGLKSVSDRLELQYVPLSRGGLFPRSYFQKSTTFSSSITF